MKYETLKRLLFVLDPEISHNLAINSLSRLKHLPLLFDVLRKSCHFQNERLKQNILDLTFQNPIGLAAGFDKNACAVSGFSLLGFGFIEVGTVTVKPQDGNPKPRLFRLPKVDSIQNAMGFNNRGKVALFERLNQEFPFPLPLGINIGKNKLTPPEKSLDDYLELLESLHNHCNYFVINISSPNTPGLRDLANENFINVLFQAAQKITTKPIFLKISPDQDFGSLLDLTQIAVDSGAAGIIATNTTTDYSLCEDSKSFGGLSGRVLKEKSFSVFDALAEKLFGKTILISVGGIDSAEEVYRRIKAGASLVQIYSALIFKGPD